MTISTPMAAALWALVFGLAALVFLAFRQLGYFYQLDARHDDTHGISPGSLAPTFTYTEIGSQKEAERQFVAGGQASLLMFADPGCAACESTLKAIDRLAPDMPDLRVLIVTSASSGIVASVDAFAQTSLPIGRIKDEVRQLYDANVAPLVFAIDAAGHITGSAAPSNLREARTLIERAFTPYEVLEDDHQLKGAHDHA